MKTWVKNNVLMFTFVTVTILFLATFDLGVKSLSALWHTDKWLLYTLVLSLNGILFMIGDNQLTNKLAGLCLIGVVLFPLTNLEPVHYDEWTTGEWLHHIFAGLFFIIKSLNHRKYDYIVISIGAASLFGLGLHLYTIEIIGLYTLIYTGYLKKKYYFKTYRAWIKTQE